MGNLSDVIDDRTVAPISMDREPLPPGKYRAEICNTEVKPTAKGGLMLKAEWDITEAGYEGRKVWHQFNIVNDSEKAQTIGRGQLSSLSQACGKTGIPEDSTELHGIPHMIKVGTESSPGYADKNVVKAFYALTPTGFVAKTPNLEKEPSVSDELPDFFK